MTYALRACSHALLAGSNLGPASGSQVAVAGDRWLLMAVRGHLGTPGKRDFLCTAGGRSRPPGNCSAVATDTVAVAVEPVDVCSDHADGALHVSRAIAAAACTVDVASDRHTGAAVVRVTLWGFLCSDHDDPGDRRLDDRLTDHLPACLHTVGEGRLVGEDLYPFDAASSYPGGALGKRRIVGSPGRKRNRLPLGDGAFLDYRACARRAGSH